MQEAFQDARTAIGRPRDPLLSSRTYRLTTRGDGAAGAIHRNREAGLRQNPEAPVTRKETRRRLSTLLALRIGSPLRCLPVQADQQILTLAGYCDVSIHDLHGTDTRTGDSGGRSDGVPRHHPAKGERGMMVRTGRTYVPARWRMASASGAGIFPLGLGENLLGDGIRGILGSHTLTRG